MMKYSRFRVCLLVFCLVAGLLGGCGKKEEKVVIGGNGSGLPAASEEETETEDNPEVYIYKAADESLNMMTFIKLGGGYREFTFSYSGATLILDRYGAAETLEEIKPGEVFALSVDEQTQKIKKMEESTDVWIYEDVENYTLDLQKDCISVGQENYRIEESVPVFDGEDQFTRKQISTSDVLTLMGYKKTLISVQITTAHGRLKFQNTEQFEGGYFVLGNVAAAKITEGEKYKVRAGEFLLKVAAKGQGGSKKITIRPGKTTTVDLKEFEGTKTKMCQITFDLQQEGTEVTINGKKTDTGEGIRLAYGTYRIEASLDGYETWSKLLFVNSKKAKVSIDLSKESGSSKDSTAKDTEDTSSQSSTQKEGTAGSLAGSKNGTNTTDTDNTGQSTTQTSTENTGNSTSLVNEVMDVLTGND